MLRTRIARLSLLAIALALAPAASARETFSADLSGFEEVPAVVTTGSGQARVTLVPGVEIRYELSYDIEGEIAQAHVHVGQAAVNGSIGAFLCTNLGNGPPGTPECPESPGTVSGTISADQVVGPAAQGVMPGELGKLMTAIRSGATYVNVHSDLFPGGEVRGQLDKKGGGPPIFED